MLNIVYVSIGGAIGALLRYLVYELTSQFLSKGFPWGTLIVNLLGSFVIGLLWSVFAVIAISHNFRLMLFVGILSSFTTFSAFSFENFHFVKNGHYGLVAINVMVSILVGTGLVFVGYTIGRHLFNIRV